MSPKGNFPGNFLEKFQENFSWKISWISRIQEIPNLAKNLRPFGQVWPGLTGAPSARPEDSCRVRARSTRNNKNK